MEATLLQMAFFLVVQGACLAPHVQEPAVISTLGLQLLLAEIPGGL